MENQTTSNWLVTVLLMVISFLVGGILMYTLVTHSFKKTPIVTSEPASQVVGQNASTSTDTSTSVAQCATPESAPVITSITPSSGPVGTVIEIRGCNFLGFESDKAFWFTNSKGEKGIINATEDASTRTSNTIAKVTIPQKLCRTMNWYSGLDCTTLDLVPDTYKIYSSSWGGNSNTVYFTVTAR